MRRCVLLLFVIVGVLHGGWLSDVVSVIAPFFYMGLMDADVVGGFSCVGVSCFWLALLELVLSRGGWLGDAVSGVACFFYMGLLDAGVWLTVAAVAVAGD